METRMKAPTAAKSVAVAAALFAVLVVVFTACNMAANLLPRGVIAEHAALSEDSPLVSGRYEYGQRILGGTVSYDNNRFILEIARQADMGDPFSTMAAADIVDADKGAGDIHLQYFRYWHGWQLLTDACLSLGTIDLVQIPAFVLTCMGSAALFLAMRRPLGPMRAAAFCVALLLSTNLAMNFMGDLLLSISFFAFLLLASVGLLLLERGKLEWRGFLVWTFGVGCVYSFLDFLTIPAVAAGLVGLFAILATRGSGKAKLAAAIAAVAAFGVGYAATWAAKWVLAAVALGPEYVAANVIGEMGVWSSGSDSLPRPDWPQALQSFYATSPRLFAICATCGYSLVASPVAAISAAVAIALAIRGARRMAEQGARDRRETARAALFLLVPCLMVLAYFLVMPTHAVVHIPVFGYKNWALVYACAILALSGLGSARSAAGGNVPKREERRKA